MTAPALPGAAPDPARLPPEVESCIEFCRSMAIPQGHPCWDALRTAIARALGGDGEPVAWGVVDRNRSVVELHYHRHRDVADGAVANFNLAVPSHAPFTVVPLFTRPAATGDTGEGEKARADFLAWVNAGYLVRDAVTDVEWDDEGLPLYYTRNDGERHYLDGEWHAWLAAKGVNCG